MDDLQPLDRAKIEEAFRIVGQYLLDRKVLGEIAIYGGTQYCFSSTGARPPSMSTQG